MLSCTLILGIAIWMSLGLTAIALSSAEVTLFFWQHLLESWFRFHQTSKMLLTNFNQKVNWSWPCCAVGLNMHRKMCEANHTLMMKNGEDCFEISAVVALLSHQNPPTFHQIPWNRDRIQRNLLKYIYIYSYTHMLYTYDLYVSIWSYIQRYMFTCIGCIYIYIYMF